MKIGFSNVFLNNAVKQQSFSSKKLFDVNLKVKNDKDEFVLQSAKVSHLERQDTEELFLLLDKWENQNPRSYAAGIKRIIARSDCTQATFAVERLDIGDCLDESATAIMTLRLMRTKTGKSHLIIDVLQSAPEIESYQGKLRDSNVKGSGELAMYSAVKLAKKKKYDSVMLYSSNNKFYEHIGFEKKFDNNASSSSNVYHLPKDLYDNFLMRVEEKYSLK